MLTIYILDFAKRLPYARDKCPGVRSNSDYNYMKLKSAHIEKFKRFSDLRILDLPEDARLIVLLGPNGSGKSSLFEAFFTHLKVIRFYGINDARRSYYDRRESIDATEQTPNLKSNPAERIKLDFHGHGPTSNNDYKKSIYLRTAYRHEAHFRSTNLEAPPPLLEDSRLQLLIDDDKAVQANFKRLIWRIVGKVTTPGLTTDKIMRDTIGDLQDALKRIFDDLLLDNLVAPGEYGAFTFSKGEIQNFLYENLSSGEKAAFDLLLDLIVSCSQFDDSLYCIDEPEAHLSTRLQGQILEELYNLVPHGSQLWIASHSIGMVRKAEELRLDNPSHVVFLDFGFRDDGQPRDFDQFEEIRPSIPDYSFWTRHYDLALDDLAKLVAPDQVVLCEGASESGKDAFDAACYNKIFANDYPRTLFISVGSSADIETRIPALIQIFEQIVCGTDVILLRDRDDMSSPEIERKRAKSIRTLTRYRNLESLLLSDEVLEKLCQSYSSPDKHDDIIKARTTALQNNADGQRPDDDLKPAAQAVHHAAKNLLNLPTAGTKKEDFMRDFLAPLITPDTDVYSNIRDDIFGSHSSS